MLSTDWASWAGIAFTVVSVFCMLIACTAAGRARRDADSVAKGNKRSVSLKKLTALEIEMTEVTDSLEAVQISLKKLRARIGMRKNREQKSLNGDGMPDPKTDPDGWKRAMRLKLHQEKR